MLALMLGATLSMPAIPQTAYAQAADDCVPTQTNQTNSAGVLVNDSPVLEPQFVPGDPPVFDGFSSRFLVLTNDNAPQGDPFDVSTLQLVGDYPSPNADGRFLILDPDNQNPPTTPGGSGDPGWEYVWGDWTLELTCNVADVLNCTDLDPGPSVSPGCISLDRSGCWPTGYVEVYLSASAQPGTYTIPYTVQTEGGINLAPATITVAFSEIPEPSPITALDDSLSGGSLCDTWPSGDFSVDLMTYVSTTGTGTLLSATIDLNPSTPGIDNSITVYNPDFPENYITFVVDENGIVTMTAPEGGMPGYENQYPFDFTIRDTDDFESNTGTITVAFSCG